MNEPLASTPMGARLEVDDRDVRWTVSDAALVLLGTQALSIIWGSLIVASVYGGSVPDPITIAGLLLLNIGLWAGYGLGPLVVARNKGLGPRLDYGASVRWFDVPIGLVVGVLLQLALPVLYKPILRFVDGDPSESARKIVDSAQGPVGVILLVFSVGVMAPLVEELFYRGLLLRSLQRRFGTPTAVLVSSAVFAAVHRQLLPLPGLFLFGLIAAWVALRSGRLGPAWAMHVGFNLTTLFVLGV